MPDNADSGRIAVLAMGLVFNETATFYNYRKERFLMRTLQWLSEGLRELPVLVSGVPNFYCGWNTACDRSRGILIATNFGNDDCSPEIAVAEEWQGCEIRELDDDGFWHPVKEINGIFLHAEPRIFSFSK